MERKFDYNASITFVDTKGVAHAALVTQWWGAENASESYNPGCNLLYVTSDGEKRDPYGQQIERATSVVHKTMQSAHGNFWCWPDEL